MNVSPWFTARNKQILQSVTKIMGKAAIWTISCFYSVPALNNVEKQWAKLASSHVMGSRHCEMGQGRCLNRLFKIPIIFCHWLSEIYPKNRKRGSVNAVPNNQIMSLIK